MAALPALFVLLVFFNFSHGYKIIDDEENVNEIIWPTEYHFKGEQLNFITSNKEPFEIWYNAEVNRSRIDRYGGTDKMYYYGDSGKIFTMVPVTTETQLNEIVCYMTRSKKEVEKQKDFLPNVTNFKYTGKTADLFDIEVDIWTSKITEKNLTKEKTLYVYRSSEGYDLPVQYIMKSYNQKEGNMNAHLVLNYYDFEANATEDVLTIPGEEYSCEDMGTLGDNWNIDQKFLHPDTPGDIHTAFESYANHHGKNYDKHEEVLSRKDIFEKNWRMVEEHNRKNLGYKLKINDFSDKTPEELRNLRGTFVSKHKVPELQAFPHSPQETEELIQVLPTNFDLRMEGVVGPVRNQGNCGSCWAFTATAIVETGLTRATGGRLLDLSEQSLVDCAWGFNNMGCDGGALDFALKYVLEHGIPTEEEYGLYKEQDGYCHVANMTTTYKIRGLAEVTPQSPNAMKVALNKYGAVGVSIHASDVMMQYASGVFYDPTCKDTYPNHGVVVVGYGVRDGQEYWVVRNSWGQDWGQGGYILMSAKDNNCLVMDTPYYPII